MKSFTAFLILILLSTGCGVTSSLLCVSQQLGPIYFIGTDKATHTNGLWLLKYVSPRDSFNNYPPQADWALIFKDMESVGYDKTSLIGRRTGYKNRFVIITSNNTSIEKFKFYRDSVAFLKGRTELGVPESINFSPVRYEAFVPCLSDTAR